MRKPCFSVTACAGRSGLAPLQRFARNLKRYARGILASARFHMHTSLLEGVNNRIMVIKRMAGFRDSDYFFLTIKAAFPGKPRRNFFVA